MSARLQLVDPALTQYWRNVGFSSRSFHLGSKTFRFYIANLRPNTLTLLPHEANCRLYRTNHQLVEDISARAVPNFKLSDAFYVFNYLRNLLVDGNVDSKAPPLTSRIGAPLMVPSHVFAIIISPPLSKNGLTGDQARFIQTLIVATDAGLLTLITTSRQFRQVLLCYTIQITKEYVYTPPLPQDRLPGIGPHWLDSELPKVDSFATLPITGALTHPQDISQVFQEP